MRGSLTSRSGTRNGATNVDGFAATAPIANKGAICVHSEAAAAVFREHGALAVVECCGGPVTHSCTQPQ
ncbi:MAG: DUF1428 family protein [bacterium]|nr:DUF1428 family protein [bacterium]